MPLHTFRCRNQKCNHSEEEIVKFGIEEISCPKCKNKMYRTLGGFNFQLKGGGWYKDGYTK